MLRSLIRFTANQSTTIINSNLTRTYFYSIDVHGQLFLSETKIRNFTSCLKDKSFLDFFYNRIRVNHSLTLEGSEGKKIKELGYEFISPCGKEMNYIKPDDSVLVYQTLTSKGLLYAGTLLQPFDPTSLRVCPDSGYLYHPSPLPSLPSHSRRPSTSTTSTTSQFGPYSLLRSSLVLDNFAKGLEMSDVDEGIEGGGAAGGGDEIMGSFEWEGKRFGIKKLEEGMVVRSKVV